MFIHQNYVMITKKQQFFLLELLWNYYHGNNRIIRKEILKKPIFSNDNDFFKQIRELKEWEYIENESYDKNKTYYKLTPNGWAFANIIANQKNTDPKYRKIAKEITWIP